MKLPGLLHLFYRIVIVKYDGLRSRFFCFMSVFFRWCFLLMEIDYTLN